MNRHKHRNRTWSRLVTATAIVGSVVVAATSDFQVADPSGFGVKRQDPTAKPDSVRKIQRERGRSIVQRLRATDDVVEIVDEQPLGLTPPPPPPGYPGAGDSYVQRITEKRGAALLIEIISLRGALTRAGDGVETHVTAEAVEVRKNAFGLAINAGDKIQLTVDGGEATVGKTKVIDRDRTGSIGWLVGSQYLVFVTTYDGIAFTTASGDWLVLEGDRFVPMNGQGKVAFRDSNLDRDALLHEVSTYSLVRK